MPTLKPYSPYESYNPNRAIGEAQHFGNFQPLPIGMDQGDGVYQQGWGGIWEKQNPTAAPSAWARQPGLRGASRDGGGVGGGESLAGGQASGGLAEGIAPINSTIDGSTPMFTPEQTTAYKNQSVGKARQLGNPRQVMKQFSRPGMSHDEGTLAAALPQITAARAQAQNLAGMIPLQDEFANQNFMLEGQVQAGQETSAMARLLQQLQQTQDFERNSAMQALLNPMLGSVFG